MNSLQKWELKRNRPPSARELKGLIDQDIEQEILYQEALTMGLEHDDELIKRRLAQKMEFISDEMPVLNRWTRFMHIP